MAVMFVADLYDTYMKGPKHFHALGHMYQFQRGFYIVFSLFAIRLRNERFHAAFAVFALLSEIFFYLRQFFTFACNFARRYDCARDQKDGAAWGKIRGTCSAEWSS